MKRIDLNKDWEFQWGEPSSIPMMPATKKMVNLPYDFMITTDVSKDAIGGAEAGFYKGSTGSYTKYITITEEEKELIHVLSFDGCYGITKVVVNGHIAARHHYGYTPFEVKIDRYLKIGNNRITVTASNTNEPNGRWYSGAGLYRKVTFLTGEKVHIVPEGIYTYTKEITYQNTEIDVKEDRDTDKETNKASVVQMVEVTMENETDMSRTVCVTVEILDKVTNEVVGTSESELFLEENEKVSTSAAIEISNAKLWDIQEPNLYIVKVTVKGALGEQDEESTQFGVRTITVDATNGLKLNGKTLKLKGGCIHHDNGIVGAAAFRDSEYRKVMLHKDAGFNALRFSHNPMSRELLSACDEIGMLVIDEAFDVWKMGKNYHDFGNFFESEWEQELTNMILRDRNHPCVFMWSVGNEIPEQGGLSGGYETSEMLVAATKVLDSTRPVGGALCSFFRGLDDEDNGKYWNSVMANAAKLQESGMVNLDCEFGQNVWDPYTAPFVKDWDIVGYNYLQYQYEPSNQTHPERVICCTESKPRELASYWADVERLPYVIGDFEWTSMDYLGEAGIGNTFYVDAEQVMEKRQSMFRAQYPARTAEAGNFDICGFEKAQIGYKKVVWGSEETFIVTHNPANHEKVELLGRYGWGDCNRSYSWSIENGMPIKIEVYSRATEVELIINGSSLGKKPAGKEQDFRAIWETEYAKGEVVAISYDVEGKEVSRDRLQTAGEIAKLVVKEDTTLATLRRKGILPVDEESVSYLIVEVTDEKGNLVSYAEKKIKLEIPEGATLLALGTGRPTTEENYTKGEITTYRGRALAVVLGINDLGNIKVTFVE